MTRFLLFFITTFFITTAYSQVDNVNPNIKMVNGEPHYKHKVKSGQTIEQIAKAYFTEPKIIGQANPQALQGLKPGMTLVIPCSFESYGAMSEIEYDEEQDEDTQPIIESKEPEPIAQVSTPPPAKKKKQMTPLEEAVGLLDEKEGKIEPQPQPQPQLQPQSQLQSQGGMEEEEESQEQIQAQTQTVEEPVVKVEELNEEEAKQLEDNRESLESLSKNIHESLQTLSKIRDQLTNPDSSREEVVPKTEPKVQAAPENLKPFQQSEVAYLEHYMNEQFANAEADSVIELREFFFVKVAPNGMAESLEDERTQTNKNTFDLDVNELRDIRYESILKNAKSDQKVAVGLELAAKRHQYKLKIKRKRIRIYRSALFVEHMKKDHPHFEIIRKAADEQGLRGKCEVIVYDGKIEINRYERFEYNPFAKKVGTLDQKDFRYVESITEL